LEDVFSFEADEHREHKDNANLVILAHMLTVLISFKRKHIFQAIS
jgi:hypothetical protein